MAGLAHDNHKKRKLHEVKLFFNQKLVDISKKIKLSKFIYLSTIKVLGEENY